MPGANIPSIRKALPIIAKETGLNLELSWFNEDDDQIMITVVENFELDPKKQPLICNFSYAVKINLKGVSMYDNQRTIKVEILQARQNILGIIDSNYDPEFNPALPTQEELMAAMGHEIPKRVIEE
jgi:hypothetical protein